MANDIDTYTGLWINWSHGFIQGATLTLPQKQAGLLSAFLALFVSFAGGLFWRMLSFVLHQANTTEPSSARDALHHQRQVILRNSGTSPAGATWALLKLPIGQRDKSMPTWALLRCLPLALLAALTLALFGVAGLFTSAVSKAPGNSTIIVGPYCGGYQERNGSELKDQASKYLADTLEAATYVQQCYRQSASQLDCGKHVRSAFSFAMDSDAACPFPPEICYNKTNSAISMDTGLLNSHVDFGINAPPKNRILLRRVATCAPLRGILSTRVNESVLGEALPLDTLYVYAGARPGLFQNYTFSYVTRSKFDGFRNYALRTVAAFSFENSTNWTPSPLLRRSDAEVTLMMLNQNGVAHTAPSNDLWIQATLRPKELEETNISLWTSEYDASLLGCIDQYQVCKPSMANSLQTCTNLTSALDTMLEAGRPSFHFNAHQLSTVARLFDKYWLRTMYQTIYGRGGAALNANSRLYDGQQLPLPSNQWQKEVSIWFSTCLAKDQAWAEEWSTMPRNLPIQLNQKNSPFDSNYPTDATLRIQCSNQLVRDAGRHQNFSVLGIGLILGLGGLIIVVGLTIDVAVGFLRPQKSRFRKDEWEMEEVLALHIAAYAGLGLWDDSSTNELPPSTVFKKETMRTEH
ncbi:hypothetical protein DL95DRAFT_496441 [Leptodontidium sp. 2 PMI_412]|nr:hypothetical protein DL95DRAFT_496441 [Leptodontidium sp. 2 PMI_412]